jgi:4-amino-4-deoxy-L-arabinose transferase-like glycosyltransferase
VFDERYYVSAARVIAGIPTTSGDAYRGAAPVGADPNAEHPQLGKLIIAGGMVVLGDNTIGWRITAVLFGIAAILLLYWLVRCAGGGQWMAVAAAGIASADNLWVVHSRIAVLDIYAVPFMLAGAAFYLRRRPVIAGVIVGIGCCVKEFAVYVLFTVALLELMRAGWAVLIRRMGRRVEYGEAEARRVPNPVRASFIRPILMWVVTGVVYFSLLSVLDQVTTPYSGGRPVDRNQASICNYALIWKSGCNHFVFMQRYASRLRDIGGHPRGIASTPTDWWVDEKAISYYKTTRTVTAGGVVRSSTPIVWYRGEIGRVVLFTSWLAILAALWWAIRRGEEISFLALAWIAASWLPPELFHVTDDRTTYLYYMVVAMPGIYIAVARLLCARRALLFIVPIWFGALLWDFAALYPFRTLSGT